MDKPKPIFRSSNTRVAAVKGNRVTLKKTGYTQITVTVPATKHYRAVSRKIRAGLK